MKLSERGALNSVVMDGGYHTYPAGRLVEMIKAGNPADDMRGDFDPVKTVGKIKSIPLTGDEHRINVLKHDFDIMCKRLEKLSPTYDIESVITKMSADLPAMARHYFAIENYKPVPGHVVEYYFEGFNDSFKEWDYIAFNIDPNESIEYNVPVGIYFKRDHVMPGFPEFVVMHENIHQFTANASLNRGTIHYVPWFNEGFGDALGFLMLYRTTKDLSLMSKCKNKMMEVDLLDSRKATYHYESHIAATVMSRGGLPFTKAFLKAKETYPDGFNWGKIAKNLLNGHGAIESVVDGYKGIKDEIKRELLKWEESFKKDGDFDQDDRLMLNYFLDRQGPATLEPANYNLVLWIMNELKTNPGAHYVHKDIVGIGSSNKTLIPISDIPKDDWLNAPAGHNYFLIKEASIPAHLREAVPKIAGYFFIVKKEYDGEICYDIYAGGLPYRFDSGELRCKI